MKIGVSFALLQGQLLAGEISRSAFLERASPLGTGTSEAAAVGDNVLAIAANHAARQKALKSSYDHIAVRSGAAGSVVARRLIRPTITQSDSPPVHALGRVAGGRRPEQLRPMVRPERPRRQQERNVLNSEAPARSAPTGQTQSEPGKGTNDPDPRWCRRCGRLCGAIGIACRCHRHCHSKRRR